MSTVPVRTSFFTHRIREINLNKGSFLPQESTIETVINTMKEKELSSILLIDKQQKIKGIITEQDIVRRIALQAKPKQKISNFMTRKVRTINENHLIYRAIGLMLKHKLQHIPVINDANQIQGTLKLSDALINASNRIIQEVKDLTQDTDFKGLKNIKKAQFNLVNNLYLEGLDSPNIQSVISQINNEINRQAMKIIVRQMKTEGYGKPPVDFAMTVMGSGGRLESFLHPDQDNAFILADYPDEKHNEIDSWFRECTQRLTNALDMIGFPLCTGYIMATNPMWRKTVSQWKLQINGWLNRKTQYAERYADIFFDFYCVYGKKNLADEIRQYIADKVPSKNNFLKELYLYDNSSTALGMFNRFITSKEEAHKGKINLKHTGTMPMVHCLRMTSLKYKIIETTSLKRLKALEKKKILNKHLVEKLDFAFKHITGLMLKQQISDHQKNHPISNYIHPKKLSVFDRELLIQSFKAIRELKLIVQEIFTGKLL